MSENPTIERISELDFLETIYEFEDELAQNRLDHITFSSIAAMQADETLEPGDTAIVNGAIYDTLEVTEVEDETNMTDPDVIYLYDGTYYKGNSGEEAVGFASKNGFVVVSDKNTSVTPEMFGAIGDGVTDDYKAIQQAFNNNKEKPVVFSRNKTYLTTGTIELKVPMLNMGTIIYTGTGLAVNLKPTENIDGFYTDFGTLCGENSPILIMLDSTNAWLQYLNFDFEKLSSSSSGKIFYLKIVGTKWINEIRFNRGRFAKGEYALYFDTSQKTNEVFNSGYTFNNIGFEGVTYGLHLVNIITGIVFNGCRLRESITALLEGGASSFKFYQNVNWYGHAISWALLGNPTNYIVNISGPFIDKGGNMRYLGVAIILNGMVYGADWKSAQRENVDTYGAYEVSDNVQRIDMHDVYNYNVDGPVLRTRPFVRTFTTPSNPATSGYDVTLAETMFLQSPAMVPDNEYLFGFTLSPGMSVTFRKPDGTQIYSYTNSGNTTLYPYFSVSKAYNHYIIQKISDIVFHT